MRKVSVLIAAIAALSLQPVAAQSAGSEIGRIKNVTSGVEVTRNGRTYRAVSGMRLVEDPASFIPALESAHALAVLPMLDLSQQPTVVINLSGRGDKDLQTFMKYI